MKKYVFGAVGFAAGCGITYCFTRRKRELEKKLSKYYHLLNKWLDAKQCGLDLFLYFSEKGYRKIGIYGMAELGWRLYYELKNRGFEIYLLDKKAGRMYGAEERVGDPRETIPDVDVMVVTASYYFADIKKELATRIACPIISIDEIIADMFTGKYPRRVDIEKEMV